MRSETQLRDGLIEVAEAVKPSLAYEAQVMHRARRIRSRRRVAGVSAAVVCMAVVVATVRLVGVAASPQLVASPPDGPFLGWAAAGNSVDAAPVQEAIAAWDRAPGSAGPHTQVRTLAAERDQLLGMVMVVQAYDATGEPRLGWFTSDKTAGGALTLRADRPAPDPVGTQVVSLVSPRLTGPRGVATTDYWGSYAVAVAMPGVTGLRVDSTAIDQMLREGSGSDNGRFVVQQLSISSTAATTTITGFAGSREAFRTAADGGAIGDAQAVPVRITDRGQQQITVALDTGQAVKRGQLAVAESGLAGRVTAVDLSSRQATIALVTSTAFTAPVWTNISNVAGTARGTGTQLLFEGIGTGLDNEVNQGQPDPHRGSVPA